jgi:uncharacterized protein (DUF1330 family)
VSAQGFTGGGILQEASMGTGKIWVAGMVVLGLAGGAFAFAKTAKPPKGYLIAEVEVTDLESYKGYATQAGPMIAACGGKYLTRGSRVEALEGNAPAQRFVIVEFKSFDLAKACYWSKAYQAIAPIRQKASKSRFWLSEGLPG